MELKRGTVVYSLAGHDKGDFQTVMEVANGYVMICDGKYRPLSRPKKKNVIHVKATNTCLSDCDLLTNKSLRVALRPFAQTLEKAKNVKQIKAEVVE